VLEWARLAEALDDAYGHGTGHAWLWPRLAAWARCRALQSALKALYDDRLRPPELKKIRRALKALRAWLEEG
jgi:hypothetical protein